MTAIAPPLDLAYPSTEPIDVPVTAGETQGIPDDPTTLPVSFLLSTTRGATPDVSDPGWVTAAWNVDASRRVPVYSVRFTPSGVTRGLTYGLWIMVGTVRKFSGFVCWS